MNKWRLILDAPLGGIENMAVDEALLKSANSDTSFTPTLRLYSWKEPTVSVGRSQSLDLACAGELGLPTVRRVTGGRAVLHDMEITYSVTVPRAHPLFAEGIDGSYAIVSRALVAALNESGVEAELTRGGDGGARQLRRSEACFLSASRYELLVGGRKLVGSAQRRLKDAFLQHGSILLDVDKELSSKLFGDGLTEKMAWIRQSSNIGEEALRSAIVKHMALVLDADLALSCLTEEELELKENFLTPHELGRSSQELEMASGS